MKTCRITTLLPERVQKTPLPIPSGPLARISYNPRSSCLVQGGAELLYFFHDGNEIRPNAHRKREEVFFDPPIEKLNGPS